MAQPVTLSANENPTQITPLNEVIQKMSHLHVSLTKSPVVILSRKKSLDTALSIIERNQISSTGQSLND